MRLIQAYVLKASEGAQSIHQNLLLTELAIAHAKKTDRASDAHKAGGAGDENSENSENGATELVNLKCEIVASVKIDPGFSGAYLPYFDEKLRGEIFFKTSRYASVKIEKISNSKGEGR